MHTLTGVVSLSTVPERLTRGLLEPTLRTLLAQTVVLPILVAVPWRSKRFPEQAYEVPKRPIKRQKRPVKRQKRPIKRQKRPVKRQK